MGVLVPALQAATRIAATLVEIPAVHALGACARLESVPLAARRTAVPSHVELPAAPVLTASVVLVPALQAATRIAATLVEMQAVHALGASAGLQSVLQAARRTAVQSNVEDVGVALRC